MSNTFNTLKTEGATVETASGSMLAHRESAGASAPSRQAESVDGALELLKNQIAWIEYVPENELTAFERLQIVKKAESLTRLLTKLNHKYND